MGKDNIISKEEKLIIEILFGKQKLTKKDFSLINYEKIVKISSSHLILPALYINLERKKNLKYLPRDLSKYLTDIYKINKNRNKKLIEESKEIASILDENKIKYVFLKGTAHIHSKLYKNIGERMIGDIDLLVNEIDLKSTVLAIKNYGYRDIRYSFFENMHYTRQVNKNKTFAIEIHTKLLDRGKENIIHSNEFLNNSLNFCNIYVPNFLYQLKHNIYNYQINDFGSALLSYSYRSYYDTYMLKKTKRFNIKKIKLDKHINRYYMIMKILEIPNLNLMSHKQNKLDLFKFKCIYSSKFIYKINYLINRQLKLFPKQFIELILNKKYREYALDKIRKND